MSIQAITKAMAIRGVSSSEKLLLIALSNYADENGKCYPSQRRLSEDTCLSDRTIRRLLTALTERGMLSRKERVRPDGSRGSDVITLLFCAEISGGAEMVSGGVRKSFPGGAEMVSGLTTFEPSLEPSSEPLEAQAPAPKPDVKAGTRLPDDWTPTLDCLPSEFGLSADQFANELAKFLDYWRAVPGAKGRKLDWDATWRNWLRRAAENQPKPRTANDQPSGRSQKLLAKEANLARSFAAARSAAAAVEARRNCGGWNPDG